MNLHERARLVRTPADLVALIDELSRDLEANPDAWENSDLPSFLAAMAAFISDVEGFYRSTGQELDTQPPWRVIADVLMGARVYE